MSKKRKFKTESKRLLELMINSIYTHKEIFLRELISNSSDAIDKYHFKSLTDKTLDTKTDYEIFISVNKDERQIIITDNGIGMTEEELVNNLGTIAKSGSLEFVEKLKEAKNSEDIDIIGQFGVGFYSAFMVASKVIVKTKSPYSEKGYMWKSSGEDSYSIDEIDDLERGTKITLYLRDNDSEAEEDYDEYLATYKIKNLVKKYSDYVRYPIKMEVTNQVPKKDEEGKIIEDDYEETKEIQTLNSMIPIWKRNKKDLKEEEVNDFYKYQFNDYTEPLKVIHTNVEGMLTYNSMIFIPKKAPHDLYSEKYEKGLQLYSKGVFIMDKCSDLVPDYLRFVRGLVDSADLSLNISREILQHNKQLTKIATNLEKKVKNELEKMLKNDRENYEEFFKTYGIHLKYGIYDGFGAKKDLLKDLLLYKSTKEDFTSLKEYVERMNIDQEFIYYASGSSKEQILALPQMDLLKDKGYEVLLLTDDIDEFAINILAEYESKKFKSINQGDLDLVTETEKQDIKKKTEDKKDLLELIKESLKDNVSDVKLSTRLKDSPVCLVSEEGISFEMERVISQMPGDNKMKASRILEINPNHDLFKALETVYDSDDKDQINDYSKLLYTQALLIEGLPIEDPVDFSNRMCSLMIKASK